MHKNGSTGLKISCGQKKSNTWTDRKMDRVILLYNHPFTYLRGGGGGVSIDMCVWGSGGRVRGRGITKDYSVTGMHLACIS